MPGKYDNLPTWYELVYLTGWKDAACPAAHRDYDARTAVHILHRLLEGLPSHLPHYAFASPEHKAELERLRQKEHEDGCDNPDCQRCVPLPPWPIIDRTDIP